MIPEMLRAPQPVLEELESTLGGVCGLGAGPMRMAVIGDPRALREMFALPSTSFRWGHKFNVLGFVVGSGSMVVSDGDDHVRRRASVQAAFSRRRLNDWIPMIVEQTDVAVERIEAEARESNAPIDLYTSGRALVLEVAVRAFFGERIASRAGDIGELFRRPQAYLESPAIRQLPHRLPFTRRSKVRADRSRLDEIIDDEIKRCRTYPTGDPNDVLEALAQDSKLSDAEIRDQVVTLIGAGYDTTAASLAWMLWRGALEPLMWGQLREEADSVLGHPTGSGAPIDHTQLAQLKFAEMFMHEVLRLHPAGVLAPREAATDIEIGGFKIKKGTLILWSPHLAGRDPVAWADPLRFDPLRFDGVTDEERKVADYAWVPFGRGQRNCIGLVLAQMELTLMIARLAQRIDLRPLAPLLPGPIGMVVNRPLGGVPMRVTFRDHL